MILRANELFLQYDYLYRRGMEKCPIYSPRDVIVIKEYQTPVEESELSLAIVLGAIAKGDELRTDWAGMTGYDDIVRHATWEDIENPSITRASYYKDRTFEEVKYYAIELTDRYEEKTVYAFDTYSQCDRYRKSLNRWHSPIPINWKPDGEIVDIFDFFQHSDRRVETILKEKYEVRDCYKFNLNNHPKIKPNPKYYPLA